VNINISKGDIDSALEYIYFMNAGVTGFLCIYAFANVSMMLGAYSVTDISDC